MSSQHWIDRAQGEEWMNMMRNGKELHASHKAAEDIIFDIKPESILDAGVGPGVTYERIRDRLGNTRYVGVDIAPVGIEKLKLMYPEADFRVGNLMSLPFQNDSFDISYTRHTLEHCPYYDIPIRELCRVSRKRVIIVLFHDLVIEDKLVVKSERHLNYYSRNKFESFLSSLGHRWRIEPCENNLIVVIEKDSV
jgi:ubiquinone/menaquinone biosynthesis C-methylase UbiE